MAISYRTLPVPAFPQFTTRIEAGPITFGVEWRRLDEAVILAYYGPDARARFDDVLPAGFAPGPVEENGLCLHVFRSRDGAEILRFDCFDEAAHYHLLEPERPLNTVVEHDVVRDGPLLDWALVALRERLPMLLAAANAVELARDLERELDRDSGRRRFDAALGEVAREAARMTAARAPISAAKPPAAAPGSQR